MNNTLLEKAFIIDKTGEYLGHEVKDACAGWLRTSERVSRTILGILILGADYAINKEVVLNSILYYLAYYSAEVLLEKKQGTSNGALVIDGDRIIIFTLRSIFLLLSIQGRHDLVLPTIYWYIAPNAHNSGGKSIRDMVKKVLGKLQKQPKHAEGVKI